MSDQGDTGTPGTAVTTTLTGAAATDKATIEGWIGDQSSPYWRGNDKVSADWIQTRYRDLIRGEQQGAPEGIGPTFQPDADLPADPGRYVIGGPGTGTMSGEDRDIIDTFAPVAHAAGLGNAKMRQAIGWALTIPNITENQFRDLAIAAGWSDGHINACLAWHASEAARRGQR